MNKIREKNSSGDFLAIQKECGCVFLCGIFWLVTYWPLEWRTSGPLFIDLKSSTNNINQFILPPTKISKTVLLTDKNCQWCIKTLFYEMAIGGVNFFIFLFLNFLLSTFLWNCFLCWDRWNGDLPPTLDTALLCISRAGTDLGHESGLVLWSFVNWVSSFPSRAQCFTEGETKLLGRHGRFPLFCYKINNLGS